jgi:predicted permease
MNDLKFALRQLAKSPGFTLVTVATLAIGIGANTAIFSLVSPVLFRTVKGVREPGKLLAFDFRPSDKPSPLPYFSYPDFLDFQKGCQVFSGMAAFRDAIATLGADEQAKKIQLTMVSPNWFELLGVQMLTGRPFAEAEGRLAGADPVVVISKSLWKRRFNQDPSIMGKEIRLNGYPFTVIGVAAPFRIEPLRTSDAWVPLTMHRQIEPPLVGVPYADIDPLVNRRGSWVNWLACLRQGVALGEARAAVEANSKHLGEIYGAGSGTIMGAYPLTVLPKAEDNRKDMKQAANVSVFLFLLSGLVLVIACANIANLLLARATGRRQEIAVRLALGATRFRLIRQLLTEGFILGLAGAAAGVLLSTWTSSLFARLVSQVASRSAFPMELDTGLDWQMFAVGLVLAIVANLVFALTPALQATRSDLVEALKNQAASSMAGVRRLTGRSALVVGQIAICFVLLVVAALFTKGLKAAQNEDIGFQPIGVVAIPIDLDLCKIPKPQARPLYDQLRQRLESLPGVSGVALARHCQGDNSISGFQCSTSGGEQTNSWANGNVVSPGYFNVMKTRILLGRGFSAADLSGPPVVVVNETLARKLWVNQDPIGKGLTIYQNTGTSRPVSAEVIGVAKDGHYLSLYQNDKRPFLYEVSSGNGESMVLLVRVQREYRSILPMLRTELQAIDKRLPIYDLRPVSDLIAPWFLLPKAGAILTAGIGMLGLFLACLGIYGLLAYMVGQCTKEFGIRLALGAARSEIVGLVMRQGVALVAVGSIIGLLGALAGTRLLSTLLFGISPLDMAAFAAVCTMFSVVALVASYIPARRATKVDPVVALRCE